MKKVFCPLLVFTLLSFSALAHTARAEDPKEGDTEAWSLVSTRPFSILRSIFRSQGVTTDNDGNWWYSSSATLLRTTSEGGSEHVLKIFPLPKELVKLKDNHIGDIDYFDGMIYAPAEDGPKYLQPHVVLYDARKLYVYKYFSLPQELQRDGVPYIAVDGEGGRAFSSFYYNVTSINVYDLKTFEPIGSIPMSISINAIQGAKFHNGSLYMTADAPQGSGVHALYKLNLSTGAVTILATIPGLTEIEGFTFSGDPTNPDINIIGVITVHGWFSKLIHLRRTEILIFRQSS